MNEEQRYELYQKLLDRAAVQLGLDRSDDRVADLAAMRLLRESVTLKILAGKDCNPSDLKWLVESLAAYAPAPEPIRCEIQIVDNNGEAMSIEELRRRDP
jgi:hypothetical protein